MSQGRLPRGRSEPRPWAAAAASFALALTLGCGQGVGIGHTCEGPDDCDDALQCLRGVCAPRCTDHQQCGEGYTCQPGGNCVVVASEVGDACQRELDCGPGQACRLDTSDLDGDGLLAGTCQTDGPGAAVGGACVIDGDCRSGTCAIGHCTELCDSASDCPAAMTCTRLPRMLAGSAPLFEGCLQASGTLELDIPVGLPVAEIEVPVPGNALSFALVSTIDDETQLVGAARVTAPSGALLYATPFSLDEFYDNPIRHQPENGISTLLVPNTPLVSLETGIYRVEVGSFFAAGGSGTAVPDVTVVYKLAPATTLDLHFHFLDFAEHPCADASGLDAQTAQASLSFQGSYLDELRAIFAGADIAIGNITYRDISSSVRPDLQGLRAQDLPRLARLSTEASGLHIFFTRSITPVGIQALAAGRPGPPARPGTRASGIAVGLDMLCYRQWRDVARVTAHEIGRQMGLFRNREPDGRGDPIPDSGDSADNLMYFSEFGGTDLSPGQIEILQLYPGLR